MSKSSIIIPIIVVGFNVFLLMHPTEMINAGRDGLLLWFNQVLPTLLPFVVGANLLAGLGFIHFIGVLMAPVMVPIFRVPGSGAYALLAGICSGYPMGARAVVQLRESGQIGRQEGQRLMAFCNNAGPLFVVGFVGVGLFGSARLGYLLLISHIAAALAIGVGLRFFSTGPVQEEKADIKKAFAVFEDFRKNHYEGFSNVLGSSVKNAMETMVFIGGFIILFCVVIKALEIGGLFYMTEGHPWLYGLTAGLIEMANGAKIIAQGGPPNAAALSATAALISFGGFSIHGQTAHFMQDTDIRFSPYLAAKALQAIIAGFICLMLAPAFN